MVAKQSVEAIAADRGVKVTTVMGYLADMLYNEYVVVRIEVKPRRE